MTDAATEIKKTWRIIAVGGDSVLELRAIWPKGVSGSQPPKVEHFYSRDYSGVDELKEAFEIEALRLNRAGFNIYVVMNPIRRDFAGPDATKDTDISYRDLLLIDIDRAGDTSSPATQAELDAAKQLSRRVRAFLAERGWPPPIEVMSGNGAHLYFVLGAINNDKDADVLIRQTLVSLARRFDNGLVAIDTTVFNASRITKVPGTIMRKGVATADRPYRMAVVCDEE